MESTCQPSTYLRYTKRKNILCSTCDLVNIISQDKSKSKNYFRLTFFFQIHFFFIFLKILSYYVAEVGLRLLVSSDPTQPHEQPVLQSCATVTNQTLSSPCSKGTPYFTHSTGDAHTDPWSPWLFSIRHTPCRQLHSPVITTAVSKGQPHCYFPPTPSSWPNQCLLTPARGSAGPRLPFLTQEEFFSNQKSDVLRTLLKPLRI